MEGKNFLEQPTKGRGRENNLMTVMKQMNECKDQLNEALSDSEEGSEEGSVMNDKARMLREECSKGFYLSI